MPLTTPEVARMQSHIHQWEEAADDRSLFLRCYLAMTNNMLAAIEAEEFHDPLWINELVRHFAGYYFVALEAYERHPATAPAVWQSAHAATGDPDVTPLQKILLGINAHINFDLVLTLVDLLRPEWDTLSPDQRTARYADHCRVNAVIGRTIDSVQATILEPAMPLMALMDRLLGPVDELLISRLISRWRETVWRHALTLLATDDVTTQAEVLIRMEQEALAVGAFIYRADT